MESEKLVWPLQKMVAKMKLNNTEENSAIVEINVVPLVDIVLVILIIFMVSAPLFIKPSLDINLPKTVNGKETKKSPLNITINKDGKIDFNGKLIRIEQLASNVEKILKKKETAHAIIAADKLIRYGVIMQVIDILQTSGVSKFSVNVERKH